jgi:RNA polymerase sigma-70 factor, ECF subfamily
MSEPEHGERKSRSGPSSGSFKVARVEVQELAALAGPEGFVAPGGELLSDELLVDRALGGEPEHFDVLMRRTAARLYRITRGINGNALRAEEVVRDTFVRSYENLSNYDRKLRFVDWLSRIAIHAALASLKRGSNPPRPEPVRAQRELVRQLEDAVDALPEVLRIAFTLCVLDDMMPADVAQSLGADPEGVRLSAFRGRLRVRRQIGMRFDDAEARAFGLDLASANAIMRQVRTRLGLVSG